jgi:arylsulfatase A
MLAGYTRYNLSLLLSGEAVLMHSRGLIMKSHRNPCFPLLAFVLLACAGAGQAATVSPYSPLLGWNAASESGADGAWEPFLNPQGGTQVWTWNTTNPVTFLTVASTATPGLTAAFRFDGQDEGLLTPSDPQAMPLDPTDQSASVEMWIRRSQLNGGRQVLLSFGGKTTGASLTLENDLLRFQARNSDVRAGIDTNSPPDGVNDDGLEDLIASIKTRLTNTNGFTHVVATIELGGTNQTACLYLNGALAAPINDAETGLFKDESLVGTGNSFTQVAGTQGNNPLSLRVAAAPPGSGVLFPLDWSGNKQGHLGRQTGDVGGTSDPASSPVYLNDFDNTFRGEIAVLNVYGRALSSRQVGVLYQQVIWNTNWPVSVATTTGLRVNYEVRIGALSGGVDWENLTQLQPTTNASGYEVASDALDWKFSRADNSNISTNTGSAFPALQTAYVFSSAAADDDGRLLATLEDGTTWDSLAELLGGGFATSSATFELWFKPANLADKQVLFETGGTTDGLSLRLNTTNLECAVRNGSNADPAKRDALASTPLAPGEVSDFVQAVGVVDLIVGQLRLYVNGALREETSFLGDTFDGGDPAGLGAVAGLLGGGQGSGFGGFDGQIAVVRGYGIALSDPEILNNYNQVHSGALTNLPPMDIRLSSSSIAENQPPGASVGVLSATDPNSGDTHAFALVNGSGDADNSLFAISGGTLQSASTFDFETRSQYSIRVRATDPGGLFVEKALPITVDNLNESNVSTQVPPNIIIYMCDDMGMGEAHPYFGKKLGPNAAPVSKALVTPNLDRLAAMGTVFTDVHTGSSMCSPTRYALLTGRYAWRSYNKHTVIGGWQARPLIAPGRPTLATLLRQYGYRTASYGKWHLGWTLLAANGLPMVYDSATSNTWATVLVGTNANGTYVTNILDGPLAHGFDYFFGVSGNFANDSAGLMKCFIENNVIQGIPTWGGAPPQAGKACVGPGVASWDQQRLGQSYMNKALAYIDDHAARAGSAPFFFYYVPNANHAPTDPATSIVVQGQAIPIKGQSRYTDGSAGNNRADMIYENNIAVGLLLDKLSTVNDPRTGRPMINSTLFIFTSDNGPDQLGVGQAGLRDKKTAIYEGGHRVPFIVSWPDGGIPAGAVNTANFGQFDLYASFSALLGHKLGVDEAEDSANALPALLNQVSGSQFRRSHLLVSHDDSYAANDITDDSALAIREHPMVLISDGKLVNRNETAGASYGTANPIKLFDLDADLHQDTTLLSDPAQQTLVARLNERLVLFHNRGHSRELRLTDYDQILLTDGGADLRNDRAGAVGYEFTTGDQPLVIQSLGLWDDGAGDVTGNELATQSDGQTVGVPDGLAVTHTVRLFDGVSQQPIASVNVQNGNSFLAGEFRFVNLAEPIMLKPNRTYALTMSTASGDGDLFHHFASFTGVGPSPTGLVTNFVARIAATDGTYPGQYPDGSDGVGNRHTDMFRHRMFVGPNARTAHFRISLVTQSGPDLVLTFSAGEGITYRVEGSELLSPADWQPVRTGIVGANGYLSVTITNGLAGRQQFYRLVMEN